MVPLSPSRSRRPAAWAGAIAAALAGLLLAGASSCSGCRKDPPPLAAPNPDGDDLVEGAFVGAVDEREGGVRIYKIVHVDDYPPPIGHELHLIAFAPKAESFEAAQRLVVEKRGELTWALDYVHVPKAIFVKRDRRVLGREPVTEEERAPYLRATQRTPSTKK